MYRKVHVRFLGEKGGVIHSRLIRPSKSSFLDNDILPVFQENSEEEEYEFKGRRIKRGLYKTLKVVPD